ncbi:MAG: ArnT family glycosyltransferase [Deltaproteobacteria bacterium]
MQSPAFETPWRWLTARPRRAAAATFLLALALALPRLGDLDGVSHPDESFYLSVVTDMVDTGHLAPSHDGGYVYQKPPLVFWASRLSMAVFGRNAFAARLPGALSGAILCSAGALFAGATLGGEGALLAGLFLCGSFGVVRFGRELMLDLPLAACLTCALALLPTALANQRWALCGAGFFAGLALGVKGPIGPFVLLVTAAVSLAWEKRLSLLARPTLWGGVALGGSICLPWYAFMLWRHPREFWDAHVVDQYFNRFSSTHGQPRLGLLWGTLLYAAPFVPLAAVGLWRALVNPQRRSRARTTLAWLLAFYGVFSLPREHGLHYPLLVLPPLAALAAEAVLAGGRAPRSAGLVTSFACCAAALAALLATGFGIAPAALCTVAALLLASAIAWGFASARGSSLAALGTAVGGMVALAFVAPAFGGPWFPASARPLAEGHPLVALLEHPGPFALEADRPATELWGEADLVPALRRGALVVAREHYLDTLPAGLSARLQPLALWRRARPYLSAADVLAAWRAHEFTSLEERCGLYGLAPTPAE